MLRRMRLTVLLLVLIALGAVAFRTIAAPVAVEPTRQQLLDENASLKAQVLALEIKVFNLERTLATQQARGSENGAKLPPRSFQFAPELRLNQDLRLPPGTQMRKFNGSTYFVVPLRDDVTVEK